MIMKKNFKLSALAAKTLSETEMNKVRGGKCCGCMCAYAGSGGSSTSANGNANSSRGIHSKNLYLTQAEFFC
jgi:natural product precursor